MFLGTVTTEKGTARGKQGAAAQRPPASAPAPRSRSSLARVLGGTWGSLALTLLILVLWQAGVEVGLLDEEVLSKPSAMFRSAVVAFTRYSVHKDIWVTFIAALAGLGLAVLLGAPLGMAMGISKQMRWTTEGWLLVLNGLPRFSLAPILIVAFGLGLTSRVAAAFLGSVIPVTLLTMTGVREIPREIFRTARSFRLSRWQVLKSIILPGIVPQALTGVRLGFSRALMSVIVAEMFSPVNGLGLWISVGQAGLDMAQLMFAAAMVAVIGAVSVQLLRMAERRIVRWQ